MIDFAKLNGLNIPEGKVVKITVGDKNLWQSNTVNYVSFGDSIAVGHRINDNWEKDYGWDAQYGVDGRKETVIVPNCYTDLIRKELTQLYGGGVSTKSFARSGDKVTDLIDKLNHDVVRKALSEADYVTVCIGANDVLHYALVGLPEYLNTGDLSTIDAQVDASLAVVNNDNSPASYWTLFNKLMSINSKATYVFTTVYNPYKYLWIDGSKNGFFSPLLNTIPQMTILGFEIDDLIKDGLLSTPAISNLVTRINGMSAKAEEYVTRLNTILRNKISSYRKSNPNLLLADTKALFDSIPDRNVAGEVHYNDLVNVEYTRGYDVSTMNWGALWVDKYGENYQQYWIDLATKYVSWDKGFDIMGFGGDLVQQIIEKVVELDVDPHPEEYGHYLLKRSFADSFSWEALTRYTITFNGNGGTGSMSKQEVVGIGSSVYTILKPNAFSITTGYHFAGWKDQYGNSYSDGQGIFITSNLTLTAQWALNYYTVKYTHKMGDTIQQGNHHTGPMEYYELWVSGTDNNKAGKAEDKLGAFSNPPVYYSLPHGTPIGVVVRVKSGSDRSYIDLNNKNVSGPSQSATYDFVLTSNVTIEFEWNEWLDTNNWFAKQDYWICNITTN